MILDFTKLHNVLERIAVALEGGAKVAPDQAVKPRGRPARGEVNGVAVSPEQAAASALAASPASSALAATGTPAAQTTQQTAVIAADLPPVEKLPTLQQVADAIIDLANNHSRDAAVKILTDNGVKKVPELKPEQFAKVLAAVAAAKAPAAASGLV